ncbi:thiamine-phosphate kinase [Vibrio rumoiensis]|uniref:Thiamine-monophosphate kinase n=1 Tax=Vibrio rumoiensis 1S-45 TaxID=1188252 RepID=A0A1E5E093_9VIBR|nr:thiamine-phosphate kinase [Vibrio rumoiensis]OEF23916.1 thiamine-phosphate kinase [Vibrio rumoiensis 1S-45]
MSGEFNLIDKYFAARQSNRDDVQLSLGDDCALLTVPQGYQLAVSTDTVVLGTHFLSDADPADVAYKALMSNISDLAAMGATPAWLSMAISMPEPNEDWLAPFCDSLFALADEHNLQLIGGDTTKGPLTISFTIQGFVPQGKALMRSGAQVGDWIYVSGALGDSHAGLEVILDKSKAEKPFAKHLVRQHFRAQSRIDFAQSLLGIASSCIDISDGLISDIKHILKASRVNAKVHIDKLPVSDELIAFYGNSTQARNTALMSGEEYELCFTIPQKHKAMFDELMAGSDTKAHCIGQIVSRDDIEDTSASFIQFLRNDTPISNEEKASIQQGFDHFN